MRLELSSRDRVALANYTEIAEGRGGPHGGVFLDISHRGKDYIAEKLPRMYRQFIEWQMLDISREPMEVAPTAHYTMGGIVVDPETHATDVPGLYAAGECVGGLHGANRLGGNSLGEALISGRRAGEAAAALLARDARSSPVAARHRRGARRAGCADPARAPSCAPAPAPAARHDVGDVRRRPRRGPASARACGSSTRSARPLPTSTSGRAPRDGPTSPTRSTCAPASPPPRPRCAARSSAARRAAPTSGPTIPELDPALQVNFHVDARMEPWSEPVPPVPAELREWAERPLEVGAERLLE